MPGEGGGPVQAFRGGNHIPRGGDDPNGIVSGVGDIEIPPVIGGQPGGMVEDDAHIAHLQGFIGAGVGGLRPIRTEDPDRVVFRVGDSPPVQEGRNGPGILKQALVMAGVVVSAQGFPVGVDGAGAAGVEGADSVPDLPYDLRVIIGDEKGSLGRADNVRRRAGDVQGSQNRMFIRIGNHRFIRERGECRQGSKHTTQEQCEK